MKPVTGLPAIPLAHTLLLSWKHKAHGCCDLISSYIIELVYSSFVPSQSAKFESTCFECRLPLRNETGTKLYLNLFKGESVMTANTVAPVRLLCLLLWVEKEKNECIPLRPGPSQSNWGTYAVGSRDKMRDWRQKLIVYNTAGQCYHTRAAVPLQLLASTSSVDCNMP